MEKEDSSSQLEWFGLFPEGNGSPWFVTRSDSHQPAKLDHLEARNFSFRSLEMFYTSCVPGADPCWDADPGFLDRGSNLQRGVQFVNFT